MAASTCDEDARYGNSSISRSNSYVSPPGSPFPNPGWNYGAEARTVADAVSFGAFAGASGSTYEGSLGGPLGMNASALVYYHDEVTVAGSGSGTIVVPWHIVGAFDVFATSGGYYGTPGGSIGVNFCQSIPVGAASGGRACTGGVQDIFHTSASYDQVLLLEYVIDFGVSYALNTTFGLGVASGSGLAVGITGDFSHTARDCSRPHWSTTATIIGDSESGDHCGLGCSTPEPAGQRGTGTRSPSGFSATSLRLVLQPDAARWLRRRQGRS